MGSRGSPWGPQTAAGACHMRSRGRDWARNRLLGRKRGNHQGSAGADVDADILPSSSCSLQILVPLGPLAPLARH